VEHPDHVRLIRHGVQGAGSRWLELGAGRGAFTLALAELLGTPGDVTAVDRDAPALADLSRSMADLFPAVGLRTIVADFTRLEPSVGGPFDGLLAANSLHFQRDADAVLGQWLPLVRPAGRLVVVEYDTDHGTPYVPHPISFRRLPYVLARAGFAEPRLIGRVPSRYLGAIYAAVSTTGA
jgi:ubiquinone/menaquinone biosynthesis C-methylase UbiE